MRIILLLFLLTIMVESNLRGQNFSIGSEVGIVSSINNDYKLTDLKNRRNTYYSGFNFEYIFDERLSFTTGLHYLRQGYKHKTCYIFKDGVKNELVGKIDYLTIPLTANIHIGKSRKFLISLGLYWAYNIKAVQDYPEPIGGCEVYYVKDLTNTIRNYNIGGVAGVGYKIYKNEGVKLIPKIKYMQGLHSAKENPWDEKYSSILITLDLNFEL